MSLQNWEQRQLDTIIADIKNCKSVVFIFKEKYGDRVFCIDSEEKLRNVCLYILWQRFHEGGYYLEPEEPTKPSMTKEIIDGLPDGKIKDYAFEELGRYEKEMRYYKEFKLWYDKIIHALKEKDGAEAFAILSYRSNYEYEGFTQEFEEKIKLPKNLLKKPMKRV